MSIKLNDTQFVLLSAASQLLPTFFGDVVIFEQPAFLPVDSLVPLVEDPLVDASL